MLSFKPTFHSPLSLSSKGFLVLPSLSAIRVVSSAHLRLLLFLLAILIPACASSSPAFLTMCSAYRINKQGDNVQPCRSPFPVPIQSVVPWGHPHLYSWVSPVAHLVKNLPAMWETWVCSLGWEDPLEEVWQPTPVLLPGESSRTEEPGRLQLMGS